MEVQHMFDNLIESINWQEAAESSYRNFHADGLHYLNLLRTPRLTAKLYVFDNVKHNSHGYLVWPHNHAYNFCHRTLVGAVTNYTFHITNEPDEHPWDMYSFETPLNDGRGLTKLLRCGLQGLSHETHIAGESYYLDRKEVHTISVKGDYAAALLFQFHDVQPVTTMFAPASEEPDCKSDLYFRMSGWQGRQLVEQFREKLHQEEEGWTMP